MKKFCKVCDNQISYDWIREHFKDEYSKYCSEECKKKDEVILMKDEFKLMVQQLNEFFYDTNRNNFATTLTYAYDNMVEFEAIKKKYGYPYDKMID